jgi:hypothetical protein
MPEPIIMRIDMYTMPPEVISTAASSVHLISTTNTAASQIDLFCTCINYTKRRESKVDE